MRSTQVNYVLLCAALLSPVCLPAQTHKLRYELPPAMAPASCSLALARLAQVSGAVAYKRLVYQLSALESAQDAVVTLKTAMEDLQNSTSAAVGLSSLFSGTRKAQDALLCSASIIGSYKPVNRDESTTSRLLVISYNQEYAAIATLEAHIKEQFMRSAKQQTRAVTVKDAEKMFSIRSLQDEAATSITQVTVLALMLSVDLSDPNASHTMETVLTREEFEELRKNSAELAQSTDSAYTKAASLFVTFFGEHNCAQIVASN